MRVLTDRLSRVNDDSGVVLIWVAAGLVALLGFAAFAVDLGHAYAVKRQLSVVADGAALAGAQEAGLQYKTLGGCNSALQGAAVGAAQANYAANVPHGGPDALPSGAVTVTCPDANGGVTVEVTLDESSGVSVDTTFGQVLGVATMHPGAAAAADVYGARELAGMRPFTVCLSDADDAAANGGTHQSVYKNQNSDPDGSCNPTGAPGNWGYATFGLGNSDKTVVCLVKNGYPGYDDGDCKQLPNDLGGVDVGAPDDPEPSDGYTGNSIQGNPNTESADVQALNSIVGETILLPVAGDSTWTGNGNNATYGGMGAIAVEFCGWAMPKDPTDMGAKNTSHSCWDQGVYDADAATWLSNQDVPSLVIQWRYTGEWVTSSIGQSPEGGCALGDATCIPALRLVE